MHPNITHMFSDVLDKNTQAVCKWPVHPQMECRLTWEPFLSRIPKQITHKSASDYKEVLSSDLETQMASNFNIYESPIFRNTNHLYFALYNYFQSLQTHWPMPTSSIWSLERSCSWRGVHWIQKDILMIHVYWLLLKRDIPWVPHVYILEQYI